MSERSESMESGPMRPLRREESPVPEDAVAALLVGRMQPLQTLSEIDSNRLQRRLNAAISRRSRLYFPVWLRAFVAVATCLFVVEVAAAATVYASPTLRQKVARALIAHLSTRPWSEPTSPAAPRSPEVVAPVVAPAQVTAPTPAPTKSVSPLERPEAVPPRAPHPRAETAVPAATAAGDDAEAVLYSRALQQLNVDHDTEGALASLQSYRLHHPTGLFHSEAAVAEIQAYLILGREQEALRVLDGLARSSIGVPQASELRLLRAELMGRADRCKEAIPLLDEYRSPSVPSALRERALYADAFCRSQLSDLQGSRQALNEYLKEFPFGRFASKARQALGDLP